MSLVMTSLKRFNLKPSPLIGETLNHLLDLVIQDPKLNEKEMLIAHAKDYLDKQHSKKNR